MSYDIPNREIRRRREDDFEYDDSNNNINNENINNSNTSHNNRYEEGDTRETDEGRQIYNGRVFVNYYGTSGQRTNARINDRNNRRR